MFKVKIASSLGFNSEQQKTLESAVSKFQVIMNSDELKHKIINFTCSLGNQFEDDLGLTNQQVFEKLYAGEEEYNTGVDFVADLHLVLVKKRKPLFSLHPAIGFGRPFQKEIYTYTWWFNGIKDYEYTSHLAHEWSHKLGFDHSFKPTPTRNFSVPYAFGNIIEELAKNN